MGTAKDINKRSTPFQAIVSYYFIAIAISFILLRLPGVHKDGVHVSLLDSLFTAVSAVSVTGLTVFDISETYSVFGIIMLLVVLQLGAIGIMSLGTFVWLIVGKKIGLRERQLIMVDHNQYNLSGVVNLIKEIIKILFLIEAVGAMILTLYFTQYYDSFKESVLHGVFTAISATTNGGFDITGRSLAVYADDYFVQTINMILITLGAIGFPVLIEIKYFLLNKEQKRFRFSLFTKITTTTYAALFVVGTLGILIVESFNAFKDMSWHKMLFASMFHSVSTRSAGLTTFDVSKFTETTDIFLSFMMFIGASPSSVGGGIRTTTFAIAVLFLINFARGKDEIQVFGREIYLIDVYRSYVVIILASTMVLVSTMILLLTEKSATLLQIIFEITSAFGTCGMSLGITTDLSSPGKVIIMILMFVGRVGLISFLYSLGGKGEKPKYHYPKERVIIG
ncbi:Ktr system potassium uptake protein D [Kurthia zopfii]|uniref:Ktr system potassium uptake protein B n=1 Tax=Kurthia zopfii TaxID=1650 RepID=A0A2U3AC31_9BACL|nr:TrkH family potassium uptake protein [Kurthia zopfii]PWI22011.1 Ktr system potassium uptake protein D [Kurthia zopfii]TDR34935.1 Trk-type K+ transport system membrane component [Kurthia zopfii]STX08911.1 Ktr system potassium uptake protein B [Kurthia zopfii]VEI04880.1 Ktr system potassium uptake protein B [Kurthia zopfii]GEK31415.1 Ktr system potassium uptake protein D [Kurthia zopfii]